MKALLLFILFPSISHAQCLNKIALSEIPKAIALEPGAGSEPCRGEGIHRCVCFDGVDWRTAEWTGARFVVNEAKEVAVKAQDAADKAKEKAKKDRLKELVNKKDKSLEERLELMELTRFGG